MAGLGLSLSAIDSKAKYGGYCRRKASAQGYTNVSSVSATAIVKGHSAVPAAAVNQAVLSDDMRLRLARGNQSMTLSEVRAGLQAGCKWVLYKGYVVDVREFSRFHPGGNFLLERNLGDDISMWFAGLGSGESGFTSHMHSARAKRILTSLIVGAVRQQASHDWEDNSWPVQDGERMCSW